MERILVALGGNAILKPDEERTAENQFRNLTRASKHLAQMVAEGNRIAITHGNGPQVGDILVRNECAKHVLPQMPLDVCGAETQGMLGYMIEQTLTNELIARGLTQTVTTILTQTIVDKKDEAFDDPTKPVGPYYTKAEAQGLANEKRWRFIELEEGFRRIVPSPEPTAIVEKRSIRTLFDSGVIIIAAGGGGVPVIFEDGKFVGVEAVIDKDLTTAILASELRAETMLFLTDVENAALNFGKPNVVPLKSLSVDQAEQYRFQGYFPAGSMGPKVEAAVRFLRGGGRRAVISSLEKALEALGGTAGTQIR